MKIKYPEKSDEELIEQAKTLAAQYVREGWGSRASVLHAIYDLFETNIPLDVFVQYCALLDPLHGPAAAIHFADGKRAGLTVCGALTSGLLAFSMLNGVKEIPFQLWLEAKPGNGQFGKMIDDPSISLAEKVRLFNKEVEKLCYGVYQHIALRFYEHFGTTDCYDLQKPFGNPVDRECFRNCARVIIWTAGMITETILAYDKDPSSFKSINDNVSSALVRDLSEYSQ